jgi:hypothetical protein
MLLFGSLMLQTNANEFQMVDVEKNSITTHANLLSPELAR